MDLRTWILGRLSLEAIPYHEPILLATFAGVAVIGLAVLALMTRYRLILNRCVRPGSTCMSDLMQPMEK